MPRSTLQYIMHDYRQRGLWILFISLLFIIGSTLGSQGGTTVSPNNPLLLLREELVGAIADLHINGDPGLEEAMAELVTQLEHLQSIPGEPIQLEWEHAGLNSTTSRSICFVVSSFEGLYLNSGIGTAYYALAELLARSGNKVTVLYTRDRPPTIGSFNDWVKHYAAQGIALKALPPSEKRITNPRLQVISAQVYQYLKLNPFDIVHFPDFEGLGFYSTLAKRVGLAFQDTLLVAGLHGPTRWVLDANEGRIPSHESELEVDYMERMSVENADVVWTPSNVLASWLSQQGWNFSRGVHLLPLPPGPEVRGVHESVHVKAKELVFFGRLEKRKGLMLFCDSIDLLASMDSIKHGLTITFLGTSGFVDGRDSMEYLQGRSGQWPFKTNIISNATRESALEYLMQRKAGRIPVIPSIIDNAPYTVYECLYAGIPFLASATPSITPLLTKHGHHLFDPKPHHLASRMVYAIRNGLASAKAVFSSQAAEDTWFSFYGGLSLLAQPPAPLSTDELPLVSVCLIHYNRPQLVQQAIASITSQDYKKIEVILVDDGSNDTSAIKYLESLQQTFDSQGWKIIRTANRYLGAARNTAAKQAQGKYLLFLDDDNVAYPHQISTYVTAAEKTKGHVITAGHAVFKGVYMPSAETVDRYWYPLGPSLSVGLFKNCFGDANFFVEKTAFLNIGGFTEEHGVGLEEHEFFAKAVLSGYTLEVVPEPLLYYRMHDEANQMLFTLDQRMGEARRIRPYIDALAPSSETLEVQHAAAATEQSMKTRRSLVNLVARNAMDSYQDCNQTLSSVTPTSGPVSGGTTISLKGVGFSCGVQAVRIDGQECTGIKVVSNYEITCQTPAGSRTYTPVDITADVGGTTIALHSAFTYTPLAAPAMNSCRLSDDGISIACSFSSLTDQSSGSCSAFFTDDTTSSFGSGANCFWTSSTILTIDLGKGASIEIGDSVSIKAGVVKSQGDSSVSNEASSTPLLAPSNPPTPVASISTPSSVGSCEGITLDASSSTGDFGRSLTYAWKLVSINPANSDSEQAVNTAISTANTANSNKVTISADDVVAAAYTFSLTVTNWIGGTASSTTTVTKTTDAVPTVSISGPSVVQMNKDAKLTLTGQVSSSCGGTLDSPTYAWTISPTVDIDSSALTSATLEVPENTFTAGTSYTVTFTATDNGLSNSATVTISVGVRPLVVSITGGNKQYQDSDTVSLDGSGSSDPEGSPITYAWSCASYYDATKPCSINTPTDSKFSFSASSLGAGKYTVTLTISGTSSRTASGNVWVEILEVSVLSISIKALDSDPVDPTQRLSLTGVLNQQDVELSDVTWSWTLTSGSLANPSNAYLSETTSQILIIAPDALTPGSSYTYKLSATQTSTGVSGTATITFNVKKAPTSGDLGCAVTSGTAESTDFVYDFGAMWGSTSGISSYEIRFVPQGSSLEIPLAEPSSNTTFTTKLPYGKYTIVGIAVSGNGVSARKECSADVTYADASDGLSQLANLASSSGLSPFEIARYAYGAKATYAKVGSSGSSTIDSIRSSLLSAVQSSISGLTASSDTAHTATFLVLTDTDLGILSQSALLSTISAFSSLLDAQAGVNNVNASVLAADVEVLSNLVDQLSNQDFDVKVLVKRDTQEDQDLWGGFQSVIDISAKVAEQYLSSAANGQSQITIEQSLLTLSLYASSTSTMSSQGVTMGKTNTVKLPPNFVSSSAGASDTLSLALTSWGVSVYPSSAAIVSPILILTASSSGSSIDLGELPSPATVFVPSSELLDNSNLACVTWSTSNSSWTTDGCTTTANSKGVTCQCDRVASYAVMRSANSRASTGGKSGGGGLDGKWIGVIAGVGGVALIALIVGAVIGVKRHRANQGATPAATPGAPASDAVAASAVPVALAGVSVDPATPRSVSGSSYSSASSRSIVSSSSSEEEIMEQQIKDIVGELSTALPRDPRALEVLGDRLDME